MPRQPPAVGHAVPSEPDSVDRGSADGEPSGDPEQEYLADGMTEQLIADLAAVPDSALISRNRVMHYKTAPKPLPAIARELQVDAIIEGTVSGAATSPPSTRTVQRPHGRSRSGPQSFERDLRDVLALQRDLARGSPAWSVSG